MGDTRIINSLPNHPKTKKLIRRLGDSGAWKLVCLFLWVASNKPDGVLTNMSVEDVELAVDWSGEEGDFVAALVDVGFLDDHDGELSLHDWEVHNPWAAGAPARKAKAQKAALTKHYGKDEAARMMQDASSDNAQSTAPSMQDSAPSMLQAELSTAPSPSPSPSPTPSLNPIARSKPNRVVSSPEGFDEFWDAYAKKVGKPKSIDVWKRISPDEALRSVIIARARLFAASREAQFRKDPERWLKDRGWEDEIVQPARASGDGLTDYQRSMRDRVDALTGGRASAKPLGSSMPLGNVIDVTPLNRKLGGE